MPKRHYTFEPHKKATRVFLLIALTTAISGYFVGLRQNHLPSSRETEPLDIASHVETIIEEHDVPSAVPYGAMGQLPKVNSQWENSLRKLIQPRDALIGSGYHIREEREAALTDRAGRRAFDGAPPTIPHPVENRSSSSCLACHGEGALIKNRVAPKMSHELYTNCLQCHAPNQFSAPPSPPDFETLDVPNQFEALQSYGPGERAYEGAPPTVPHPTLMRTDCMSCHGPNGQFGLRTSHPLRQNCLQCHAPSAELDQRRDLILPFPTAPDRLQIQ